jgi:hypothetical protein
MPSLAELYEYHARECIHAAEVPCDLARCSRFFGSV